MNPTLAALALATVAGAVLAVAARDVRSVVLGLLVVLLAAPLVTSPWPGPIPILIRVAASLLAIRLIVVGVRGLGPTAGTRIGWLPAAILAAGAATAGFASHGLGSPGFGPPEAQAAAFALVALAVAPLIAGRDVLRLGVGALLLIVGAQLMRAALDRPAGDVEQLIDGLLTVGIGGAIAVIAGAAGVAGGLEAARLGGRDRAPRPPDAHRIEAPAASRPRRSPP